MSGLSDYLMEHHFDVMTDETIPNIDDAALKVIKAQDAKITEYYSELQDWYATYPARADWPKRHPTPPARAGTPTK